MPKQDQRLPSLYSFLGKGESVLAALTRTQLTVEYHLRGVTKELKREMAFRTRPQTGREAAVHRR